MDTKWNCYRTCQGKSLSILKIVNHEAVGRPDSDTYSDTCPLTTHLSQWFGRFAGAILFYIIDYPSHCQQKSPLTKETTSRFKSFQRFAPTSNPLCSCYSSVPTPCSSSYTPRLEQLCSSVSNDQRVLHSD